MGDNESNTALGVVIEKRPPTNETEKPETGSFSDFANMGHSADVAYNFLATLDPAIAIQPITPEESRKLLWKIDLILLPLVGFSVIIAAVDKVVISNAAIYGMKEDTHLVGNQFSWVGSIFYFGYLIAEWPGTFLMQRLPLRFFYAGTIMCWAIFTFITGATHNFGGLAAVRFLMGMFEAVVFPVCSLVSAMWWTKKEQPIRVAIWFNTLSSIVTGLLSYGIGHTHTSVSPWRILFFVLGAISVIWSCVCYAFLPSSPVEAWWLSDREKFIALDRVRSNNTGIEDKKIKWYQVKECLMDPKPWLLGIFACTANIPNGGFVTFAALIVNGLGFSPLETVLIGMPTGVVGTLWSIILNVAASCLPGYRCILIALGNAFTLACAVLLWKLPRATKADKTNMLGAYYGVYSYWACYTLSTSLPMANTSGHSKKVASNAIFFLGYCVGNIVGPQLFQSKDAPNYHSGYIGLVAVILAGTATILAYGLLCHRENKKRDKLQGGAPQQLTEAESLAEAFSDKTDKEKLNFRYTY